MHRDRGMFGFGKKEQPAPRALPPVAGLTLEILHNTQKEILEELDAHLVSEHEATYAHSGSMYFYSGKVPNHLDMMSYKIGFIHGVCQSYHINEEQQGEVVVQFVTAFDKTIGNHTRALNIPDYTESFFDLFVDRWENKVFMHDDAAAEEFLLGLTEGKEWADADQIIQKDYSKLRDVSITSKLNLDGFRGLINGWKLNLMLNDEAMALISMPQHWTDEQIDAELRRKGIV